MRVLRIATRRYVSPTVSKRWSSSVLPTLYVDTAAPPARFVLMTARALDLKLHLEHVDLFAGEQMTEAYLKINPLGKVPALVENDLVIKDSHAIALHLCAKKQNILLYPEDQRTKIHELMFFHSGTLFPIDSAIMSEYFSGTRSSNFTLLNNWLKALDYLEDNLKQNSWFSGKEITLADLCCSATISSMEILVPLNKERYPRITRWMIRLKKLPLYEVNFDGLMRLKEKIDAVANT